LITAQEGDAWLRWLALHRGRPCCSTRVLYTTVHSLIDQSAAFPARREARPMDGIRALVGTYATPVCPVFRSHEAAWNVQNCAKLLRLIRSPLFFDGISAQAIGSAGSCSRTNCHRSATTGGFHAQRVRRRLSPKIKAVPGSVAVRVAVSPICEGHQGHPRSLFYWRSPSACRIDRRRTMPAIVLCGGLRRPRRRADPLPVGKHRDDRWQEHVGVPTNPARDKFAVAIFHPRNVLTLRTGSYPVRERPTASVYAPPVVVPKRWVTCRRLDRDAGSPATDVVLNKGGDEPPAIRPQAPTGYTPIRRSMRNRTVGHTRAVPLVPEVRRHSAHEATQ
jgi:hypothetical protein